jgi:GntR family transcriptional repressor for pyruvate dehydrogenase complex
MTTPRPSLTVIRAGEAADPGQVPRPARRPKLATIVREHILAEIRSGRWQPGDRIPTELELMARFGVSRAPVREAMQSLHLLGIVDVSPRRGATVRALPVASVIDLAILSGAMGRERSVDAVFEFRDAMDAAIGELAAANASDAEIEKLRTILVANMSAVARGDRVEARNIDVRFHAAIAEASGNLVFQAVAHAVSGLLVEFRRMTGGIPGAAEASVSEHREIFNALAVHDAVAARRASERHIRNTRARYESARREFVAPTEVSGTPA